MGDKSPKAKEKARKQIAKEKDRKKADAQTKASIMTPMKQPA